MYERSSHVEKPAAPSNVYWALSGVVVAASCLPLVLTDYLTFQATLVLISAIALLGVNLLCGYNGQISLGHGAFFACGAYTVALTTGQLALPYWLALAIAAAVCLCFGIGFGLAAPRRAVPRAGDLRLGRGAAATAQVPKPRTVDRRRAGREPAQTPRSFLHCTDA